MLPSALWLLCLAVVGVRSQEDTTTTTTASSSSTTSASSTSSSTGTASSSSGAEFTFTNSFNTITTDIPSSVFTGSGFSYAEVTSQSTRDTSTSSNTGNSTATSTSTASSNGQITLSTRSVSLTVIGGTTSTMSASNATTTSSSTSSAARPSNTLPCNGWPEFCNRQYSNITYVVAHNAAFVQRNNVASNQRLPVIDQLNDGVRMIQGEVHWENNTLYNCHTSCTLLNTGPYQSTLEVIRGWLQDNPYEVLSILIVNSDMTEVENFVPAITNAGLLPYVYEPAYIPQYRDQWPTLGEMILRNQRLVIYMDYRANQNSVPYILDEFTHMWETPFSPTNQGFPCTTQRPPDLNQTVARNQLMNLANHNLNTAIDLSSLGIDTDSLLVPNTAELNLTNAEGTAYGSLGLMSDNCTAMWDRAPNFLLVDYYNYGSPEPGSVFHVAARANGVTYTRECCENAQSAASGTRASLAGLVVAVAVACLLR